MTYIIAEAGINHNGSWVKATGLINHAILCGCDAVKFQCFQKHEVPEVWEQIKQYVLLPIELKTLKEYCNSVDDYNIDFLCSAFGMASQSVLKHLGCKTLKIPSGKITDQEYLEFAAESFDKFILSSGMSDLNDIDNAVDILGVDRTTVLHCVSAYPAPLDAMNLLAMRTIKEQIGCEVGLSDHTEGYIAPIVATALGASVIEKHITLDKNLPGPDHKASLDPQELFAMVQAVRDTEKVMGNGKKEIQECEKVNLHRRQNEYNNSNRQ